MSTAKAASALCALQDTRRSPPSGNTPRSVSHSPLIEPDGLSVCRLECQAGCALSWSGLALEATRVQPPPPVLWSQ